MKKQKVFFLVLLVLLVCLIVSSALFASEKVIRVAVHAGIEEQNMRAVIDQFEKKTGIKVELFVQPYSNMFERLLIEMSNKTGSIDLALLDATNWFPAIANAGFLAPVDKYYGDKYLKDFFDPLQKEVYWKDKKYGFPFSGSLQIAYYRTDLFKQAGLNYPTNKDEFVEAAIKLTQDTDSDGKIDVWGAALPLGATVHIRTEFLQWLWTIGGDMFDNKWNPIFNNKEGVEALTLLVDLYYKHKVLPTGCLSYDYNNTVETFLQGKVAMAFNWSGYIAEGDNPSVSKVVKKWTVGKRPGVSMWGGYVLGIPIDSRKKDEAAKLAFYLTSPESIKTYLEKNNSLPIRKSVALDPKILKEHPAFRVIVDSLPNARFRTRMPEWPEIDNIIKENLTDVMSQKKTPKEALDIAAQKARGVLKEAGYY